jgi:hypothetical protein
MDDRRSGNTPEKRVEVLADPPGKSNAVPISSSINDESFAEATQRIYFAN